MARATGLRRAGSARAVQHQAHPTPWPGVGWLTDGRSGIGWWRSVEPSAERCPFLEPSETSPGGQQRFLECILGILKRSEHPVAMHLNSRRCGSVSCRNASASPARALEIKSAVTTVASFHLLYFPHFHPHGDTGRAANWAVDVRPISQCSGSTSVATENTKKGKRKWEQIVVTTNVSLDGVVQDPDGQEGFRHGGWFGQFGGKDLEAWAEVMTAEAMHADALLLGRKSDDWFATRWSDRTAGGQTD